MKKIPSILTNTWLWCTIIFIIAIGLRCYRFADKNDMFSDEHLTILLSNYNECPWDEPYRNDSTSVLGEDLTKLFLSDNNSPSYVINDIKKLRYINRDPPQTNLYYSLFRIGTLGANTDVNTIDVYLQRGFYLNMLFFVVSFILLFWLAKKLFKNQIFIACTLAVAFLTPASIGNTLFLRPYQLQETLLIAFTCIFVRNILLIFDRKRIDTWQNLLVLSSITSLLFLSGYFAIFYAFILGAILIYSLIRNNQKRSIPFIISSAILAYILCLVLYIAYNSAFSLERGPEAMNKISLSGFTDNAILSITSLASTMSSFFISIPLLVLLLLIVTYIIYSIRSKKTSRQKDTSYLPLVIATVSFIWAVIVFFFAPYKVMRYIMPILPLMSLAVPFVLSYLDRSKQLILTFLITLLVIGHSLIQSDIYWGLKPVNKEYTQNPQIPMIVGGIGRWEQTTLIPYFTTGREIEFSFSPSDFDSKIQKHEEVYVFIQYNENSNYLIPSDYNKEAKSDMGKILIVNEEPIYYVYKLTRKEAR